MLKLLASKFKEHADKIDAWFLEQTAKVGGEPLYASVDLRNAGYKIAPVDTNIFPAGFNNLCPSYRREASRLFSGYIKSHYPATRRIAILAENHTRNAFYFEHLFYLKKIIEEAGFQIEITTLAEGICGQSQEFETAEHNKILVYKGSLVGDSLSMAPFVPDLIVVNNDFSAGIPRLIKKIVQPMVPAPCMGWHTRKKSGHFMHYECLAKEFSALLNIDPWLISAPFSYPPGVVHFSDDISMRQLAGAADELLRKLKKKHDEYSLSDAPYVFVKNEAGTYGMAVMNVQSGDELLHLNKKQRQNMRVGKGGRPVSEVIIQEGIPTIDRFKGSVAEPVIYLIANHVSGGFFRLHEEQSARENLNTPGMKFTKLCFHEMMGYSNEYKGECDLECLGMIYKTIARIASIAAGYEITHALRHRSA